MRRWLDPESALIVMDPLPPLLVLSSEECD